MKKFKTTDHAYHEEKIERARQEGFDVVEAKGSDIQIDLDSQQDGYVMDAMLAMFRERGVIIDLVKVTRSKSGNKHVYLKAARKLSPIERIAFQAVLGSDRKREALSLLRIIDEITPVTVFFEKPENA